MSEPQLDRDAAAGIHYVDPRVRQLAAARWRLKSGGTHQQWLALGKDNPEAMITPARDWVRAAVAAGMLPPYEPTPDPRSAAVDPEPCLVPDLCPTCEEAARCVGAMLPPGSILRGTILYGDVTYDRNHGYADRHGVVWFFETTLAVDGTFNMSNNANEAYSLAAVEAAVGPLTVASVNGVHRRNHRREATS